MELTNHLGPNQILLDVRVKDKWELLDLMCKAVSKHPICRGQNPEVMDQVRPGVIAREKSMSTGMCNGYALPHARIKGFGGFVICIAVLKDEIEYETIDNKPVKIVCMVITPEENPTVVLKLMSALSRFMTDDVANYVFFHEKDPAKLYEYLKEKKISLDISIAARDIMRIAYPFVLVNMPLRQITHIMLCEGTESIAVVDDNNNLKGEITCDLLFKKGVPDFFNQLSSVSFVKHYDPFAKYFSEEANAFAKQIMSADFAAVDESATLMEIVYLLSVKRYNNIYVVKKNKLCGTIDRTTVLDQILNL